MDVHIKSWYCKISPDPQFTDGVSQLIHYSAAQLAERASAIAWPEFLVKKTLPEITLHLQGYLNCRRHFNTSNLQALPTDKLSAVYGPLHAGVDNPEWLKHRTKRFLRTVAPPEIQVNEMLLDFVSDIVAFAVLRALLGMFSNPDFWNQLLVRAVESKLRDTDMVMKLRQVIQDSLNTGGSFPKLTQETDPEGFDKFLESIDALGSLETAKQLRYTLTVELHRLSTVAAPSAMVVTYKERLETSKAAIDYKLRELEPYSLDEDTYDTSKITLNEVLADDRCMTLFNEYLDLQGSDGLKIWTLIEDLDHSDVDPLGGLETSGDLETTYSASEKAEIQGLFNKYGESPYINKQQHAVLGKFLATDEPSRTMYLDVQRVLIQVKDKVAADLETHVVGFKQHPFFLKFVARRHGQQATVDRLQLDDVSQPGEGINHELVYEAMQELLLGIDESPGGGNDEEAAVEEEDPNMRMLLPESYNMNFQEKLSSLEKEIAQLKDQMDAVGALLRKAELTDNHTKLRLLKQSLGSLEREVERRALLRDRLSMRWKDATFFDKVTIAINECSHHTDSAGEFTAYQVKVQSEDDSSGWVVPRRYRQFHALHRILRLEFAEVRALPFPKKKMVLKFQQKQFVESRRQQFEAYLQELVKIENVSKHMAFRMFLTSTSFPLAYFEEVELKPSTGTGPDKETKVFVQPICDAFMTLFKINDTDWLGGKVVILVLQQVLGGTIEKRVRDSISGLGTELPNWLSMVEEKLKVREPPVERSLAEKMESKEHALLLFNRLAKRLFQRVVGVSKARHASECIFQVLQTDALNTHIFLVLIDLLFKELEM